MGDKNQSNSSKEPYINLYDYHENSEKSKSFKSSNIFNQGDDKEFRSK